MIFLPIIRRLFLLIITISLPISFLFASPGGVSGRTLKSNKGCTCHFSTANTGVVVTIIGPDTVTAGQSYSYSVTVTGGTGTTGGVDIAVLNGTISPVSSFLQLLNSELTHNNGPITVPSNYQFTYTAPVTPGTDLLYATGKGANFEDWNWAPNKSLVVKLATGVSTSSAIPVSYKLEQNYPNPFNPTTTIRYSLPTASVATIKVFDIQGKEVATIVNDFQPSGDHSIEWRSDGIPSGIYLYKIVAGNYNATRKMVLLK